MPLQGPTAQEYEEQEAFERALYEYAGVDPGRLKKLTKNRNEQMDEQAKALAESVLKWWEEAKYMTTGDRADINVFSDEPDFVKQARVLLKN